MLPQAFFLNILCARQSGSQDQFFSFFDFFFPPRQGIGRVALNLPNALDRCVATLRSFLTLSIEYVTAETVTTLAGAHLSIQCLTFVGAFPLFDIALIVVQNCFANIPKFRMLLATALRRLIPSKRTRPR
jgi:hypothetical protein